MEVFHSTWQPPQPCGGGAPCGSNTRLPLSAAQVSQWRDQGWLVLSDIFPAELIDRARRETTAFFAGEPDANVRFPADDRTLPAVNQLALHPRLQRAASQLLGEPEHDLRLCMSNLLRKPGDWRPSDGPVDQADGAQLQASGMHYDSNNTLAVPLARRPEAVVAIVYYDAVRP